MILPGFPASFSHNGYEFKSVVPGDVAQIRAWLREPHIVDWWTPNSAALAMLEKGQMGETNTLCFIVSFQGRPFGYIQCYDPAADTEFWGDNPQSAGTYGIDQFIGDVEMIGFGHGTNFIKAFVAEMKKHPDIKRIIVDPAPDNAPAIRCYSQVGFRREKAITTPDGAALLMVISKT